MLDHLIELYYVVSQGLLAPVMLLLLLAMAAVIFQTGQTVREGLERLWLGGAWRRFIEQLRQGKAAPSQWRDAASVGLPRQVAKKANANASDALRILIGDAELDASRQLGKLQILIRVGPMLGLIGTLVPLGPALQGLSDSNFAEVGENLNIAFTTTVFGILVGGVAYALYIQKRGWFDRDLHDLEGLAQTLQEQHHAAKATPLAS
jgi:biopolymer transport protein ExbB/TolQ